MSKLTDKIEEKLAPVDCENEFDNALDEGDPVRIGSLEYTPSRVLKRIDPIAYRCGVSDYVDSLGLKEINWNSYDSDKVDKICDELVEELENEISSLQDEVEEAEEDVARAEDEDSSGYTPEQIEAKIEGINFAKTEVAAIQSKLDEKEAELEGLKKEIKSL
jgi:polyhydroxyalkanoate synthesis regulator phasin